MVESSTVRCGGIGVNNNCMIYENDHENLLGKGLGFSNLLDEFIVSPQNDYFDISCWQSKPLESCCNYLPITNFTGPNTSGVCPSRT